MSKRQFGFDVNMALLFLREIATSVLTHWGRDKMTDILQTTFSNAYTWMKIYKFRWKNSLKFVLYGLINNIPALVQIMAWCRSGGKPISDLMMVSLLTHICVTRPQWVNVLLPASIYNAASHKQSRANYWRCVLQGYIVCYHNVKSILHCFAHILNLDHCVEILRVFVVIKVGFYIYISIKIYE